ncbi:cellobiose phosphorylase [Pontibacillus sp. HMF3514]|uniref:cellobiose phosphorylase n=1 Tax=Pontibacillus sp. HMF3514 TaxID=2692425 RepID=UPI00131FC837|nr:cellobiose phosphorylase [Pontibacillus sp. HMF3514]QHE53653.1 cellobiose phosphorylase [Pontibacillus sp. HMF3514]
MVNYTFNDERYFVIENFDQAKTFSSFLPGLAGLYGVPMWAFYVNRGQGLVSFGIQDKQNAITEFFPANQAYERVSINGFRTFIKVKRNNESELFEPFSPDIIQNVQRNMFIKENELIVIERNEEYGIETHVTYFTLPNENFAALMRKVQVKNISDEPVHLEVVDGLPAIIPFGIEDAAYKAVGNTLKSWMDVFNLEQNLAYFRVRSSTGDTAEVEEVTKGHFYASFTDDGHLLKPIVDAKVLFGENTSLRFPNELKNSSVRDLLQVKQVTANKVPCGFSAYTAELSPDERTTLHTMIGHVSDLSIIEEKKKEITSAAYFEKKYEEAQEFVDELTRAIHTKTGDAMFDAYAKQSFLDNVLRGGYPILLENDQKKPFPYYVYSRKHGDLERDYNFFSVAPEFFSQGNGNFRDVNQNRRNDVFFKPEVGDYNIKLFMSLIQADGYNPLVVKGSYFEIIDQDDWSWLGSLMTCSDEFEYMKKRLALSFTPGGIMQAVVDRDMRVTVSPDEFLKVIFSKSRQEIDAEFGEGYWVDHWTYNLDLIKNYLSVFPDHKKNLLNGDRSYRYFYSPVHINPRSEKYVLADNKVRQYGAIKELDDAGNGNWLLKKNGQVYESTLFSKLFTLALVKFATLDPYGMGIEMEANKPGWNDSMNGLPGIFGSGMSETIELKRLLQFMIDSGINSETVVPVEVYQLVQDVKDALQQNLSSFDYWNTVSSARESYRLKIQDHVDGKEEALSAFEVKELLQWFMDKVNTGIDKAKDYGDGLVPTYFYYEVDQYELQRDAQSHVRKNEKGYPLVQVQSFDVHVLPHFLEGPARALKDMNTAEARELHQHIRHSELYDEKLGMYKTSASLEDMSYELGRARAFTPGWLERESVFMHMEFKYLLSLLNAGLYEDFFKDIQTALPPFMDPGVYGRSTLENSSFIASSVNPDESMHGRGFVARLSGTTAEFLSMWNKMMTGQKLFSVEDDELVLTLQPVLPEWLFDESNQAHFTLLGEIEVTYHNEMRKPTFGDKGAKVTKYVLHHNEESITVDESEIRGRVAEQVRDRAYSSIDVFLT